VASEEDSKRVFFAMEVTAPWPEKYPDGRLLPATSRHLTLAFLGNTSWSRLEALLPEMPKPSFRVGPAGFFDQCLFLPPRRPRVVAWHVHWWDGEGLAAFQEQLATWLRERDYAIDERPFLSHVTVARWPFVVKAWEKAFKQLPMIIKGFHLYESVGNLCYEPIWRYPLLPPIEALEHTADVGFIIRGETLAQLEGHAQAALVFEFPSMLNYLPPVEPKSSLEDIIIALNAVVTAADKDIGCPFKAVSFHGDVVEDEDHLLTWEMIVDV